MNTSDKRIMGMVKFVEQDIDYNNTQVAEVKEEEKVVEFAWDEVSVMI